MRFLKILLTCLFSFLAVFAVACLVIWVILRDLPDTLVIAVFGVAGVESMVGGIIKTKERKESKQENTDTGAEDKPRRAE